MKDQEIVILTRHRWLVGLFVTVFCIVFLSTLVAPSPTFAAAQKTVLMSECEIDGFGLGASADQMRETFGEPEKDSVVKPVLDEYPHREYAYDGLTIVFSTNGRSALSFYISSSTYQLQSGIGVGSMWSEIIEAFGPGSLTGSGGSITYSYNVVDSHGDLVPARLRFRLENEIVASFSVVTTR